MKKYIIHLILIAMFSPTLFAASNLSSSLSEKITQKTPKKKRKANIYFNFKDEDLVDIINMMAELKNVNIVLPTGANAISVKVNLVLSNPLTLDEAWDILYTLLDIAGYSLIKKKDLYIIVKNNQNISREPLPIFINTPFSELPKTDERITYIYYLSNIKASQEFDNQLGALFKELLPPDALYKADKNANGILLVAKAQDIRSIMEIVEAMDQTGFQERLEMIRLRYTTADTIAKIFNEGILKTATATPNNRFRAGSQGESTAATYFSQNVRVIPEPRTNSLVVLGRVQAVERVKDFIFKYIDTQLDSGNSILHVYELQYLDADEFAPVLQKIVDSSSSGGTEQSSAGGGAQYGVERLFEKVIIRPDSPPSSSEEGAEGKYFGGNKLVVAARNDDWKRIEMLIEKLDKPQPQVIIEVLICDLTLDDTRRLGAITRNLLSVPFAGQASFQSAMVDQVILDAPSDEPAEINKLTSVASDLNSVTSLVPNSDPAAFTSLPANLPPGTAVLSISESGFACGQNGRTWSILQILKLFSNTKVLSHPHIIATNNQTASIEVGQTRLVQDQAASSTSGITVRKKELKANTNLKITPRISSANTVNLQVVIDIDQFESATDLSNGNRFNRDVVTNASVKSGDILAIGGLIQDSTEDDLLATPVLSQIPIFGWLFRQKAKIIEKTALNIFITPTIVQPKLRGGIGDYTRTYAENAKDYTSRSGLFDSLRDPITRWFFLSDSDSATVIDEFLQKDETQDLSHPEAEFVRRNRDFEEEEDILDNPHNYDKTGKLKTLLKTQTRNPIYEYSVGGEFAGLENQAPSTTRQLKRTETSIKQTKPVQKRTNIIPAIHEKRTTQSSATKGKENCGNNTKPASCAKQNTCNVTQTSTSIHTIPCPQKKVHRTVNRTTETVTLPAKPKPDLKTKLAAVDNPLKHSSTSSE